MKKTTVFLLGIMISAFLCACGTEKSNQATEPEKEVTTEKEDELQEETILNVEAAKETETAGTQEPEQEETGREDDLFNGFIGGSAKALINEDTKNELVFVCMEEKEEGGKTVSQPTFQGAADITLKELAKLAAASPNLDTSGMKGYYAVMEDQSGSRALVVKYQGMGLDGVGDDSCAYFVFAVKDGKLNMVYSRDSWSRRYSRLNKGLIFTGYSTQGAGDSIDWCGRIDGNGYKPVYSVETLSEDWVAMNDEDSSIDDTEWSRGCVLRLITIGKDAFFNYEASETVDQEKLEKLISSLEKKGMKKAGDDTEKLINAILGIEGIDKESLEEFEEWIPLQVGDPADGQASGQDSAICVYGPVKEITDEGILIDNQSGLSSAGDMFLSISLENTKLLDALAGTPVLQTEIKENETVYAYIGDTMTMSLPPRVETRVVLAHPSQEFRVPAYITVKNMEVLEGGRFKITVEEGGEFILNAETNIFPYKTRNLVTADDIVEKSKCLIWCDDSGNVDKLLLFSN